MLSWPTTKRKQNIKGLWSVKISLTKRPTRLLWRLICDWKSPMLSRESKKSSENSMPKLMLWEHPAHFHPVFCLDTTSLVFISYARSCLLPLSLSWSSSPSAAAAALLTIFLRVLSVARRDFVKPLRDELGSQPHDKSFPWLHALATLCTTPADAIAWPNALSR